MPELPEVETMRRGILKAAGSRIAAAGRVPCPKRPIAVSPGPASLHKRIVGQRIESIGRVGKRVVIHLEKGDALVFEPRMTGLVLVADPPTREHLRFRLDLKGGPLKSIWYWDRRGLGSVRLLSRKEFEAQLLGNRVGPDALAISAAEMQERMETSKRAIKVALLDQRALAGVGNLYASEILHLCGIHPARRCDLLRNEQWEQIHARMREVLELAIKHEGSTLSDGTYRNALNQSGGYQSHHRVYDRAGDVCLTCSRGSILRIVQAQRATFFCPECQRKRK
ncbi:MAG: bifunctional DNA-formamidopyrimidine glycosylase/DNA-(apurinic or apyrimidinic site) lyase [Pirellulaceae bacterium]|nr:bifunctional DNA-formamidopyrimidine glycosylase/DNA-(apurinic or apyrimidinic site) lyase [Pirellulaceae bacterium]